MAVGVGLARGLDVVVAVGDGATSCVDVGVAAGVGLAIGLDVGVTVGVTVPVGATANSGAGVGVEVGAGAGSPHATPAVTASIRTQMTKSLFNSHPLGRGAPRCVGDGVASGADYIIC